MAPHTERPIASFETAKSLRAHLDYLGVVGEAQDALVRETAGARHTSRIERAREAAMTGANLLFVCLDRASDDPDHGGGYSEEQRRVAAALLLRLDQFGSGGRDGVEGLATDRLSPFICLGSGRKQASDGPAWNAAILAAERSLLGDGRIVAYAERELGGGAGPAVSFWIQTGEEASMFVAVAAAWAPEWLLPQLSTLAREALRRAAGLPGWFDTGLSFNVPGPQSGEEVRPAIEVWGAVVNALAARSEAFRAAADENSSVACHD